MGRVETPYIAFEGVEGVGKSTLSVLVAQALDAEWVKENGATELGAEIRKITHGFSGEIEPWAEAYLFAADRAQLTHQVVAKHLAAGRPVVTDRSLFSSIAYQGYGRELLPNRVADVNRPGLACLPTHVVHLVLDPEEALRRISDRNKDRIESEGSEFFARVAHGFRALGNPPIGPRRRPIWSSRYGDMEVYDSYAAWLVHRQSMKWISVELGADDDVETSFERVVAALESTGIVFPERKG